MPKTLTTSQMTELAERRLRAILIRAQDIPSLARLMPAPKGQPRPRWEVSLRLVGAALMTRLNDQYRGKAYPTDVLSFPAPSVFAQAGLLGDLVICLPTLRKQAQEQGHSERRELEVLLVHGVLHLLGLDHELGPREAARMARWEAKLLGGRATQKGRGLIRRAGV